MCLRELRDKMGMIIWVNLQMVVICFVHYEAVLIGSNFNVFSVILEMFFFYVFT